MKETTTKKTIYLLTVVPGLLVLLIFIASMKSPSEKDKTYTYLALGDSYTIGEQVAAQNNFPNQVVKLLANSGIVFQQPDIIAKTGWTTDELTNAIHNAHINKQYDYVTLLIGVNNQYRGRNVADYAPGFEDLLKQAISFAGHDTAHVIVLSIPDWGVTPFAEGRDRNEIAREIDAYNEANRQIAAHYNVPYINITPGTRQAGNDLSLVATDGLHPSGKEYSKWAAQVADLIQKSL